MVDEPWFEIVEEEEDEHYADRYSDIYIPFELELEMGDMVVILRSKIGLN